MKAEIDWRGKKEEKRLYWKVREERKQLVRSLPHDRPVLQRNGQGHERDGSWDMHAIIRRLHEAYQLKKPPCFTIREGIPDNMQSMLHTWQHNPEGVPTAIRQEDDGSLNLLDVDIWMWLKIITPSKGMMIRQRLMQLFGEASQWASLVDASKLPAPHSSKLCNST